jgi:hypothetical protein
LIVEIDGGQHDRSSPRETERSGFLQSQGYRILRFWNNEVLANPDGVHQTIANALRRITPTQTLPHHGGGFLPTNNPRSNNSWRGNSMKGRLSLEPSPMMGESWEGVMFPATQEASDSLRTLNKTPGQLLREDRETGPG